MIYIMLEGVLVNVTQANLSDSDLQTADDNPILIINSVQKRFVRDADSLKLDGIVLYNGIRYCFQFNIRTELLKAIQPFRYQIITHLPVKVGEIILNSLRFHFSLDCRCIESFSSACGKKTFSTQQNHLICSKKGGKFYRKWSNVNSKTNCSATSIWNVHLETEKGEEIMCEIEIVWNNGISKPFKSLSFGRVLRNLGLIQKEKPRKVYKYLPKASQ
jgi:hypothetical protein